MNAESAWQSTLSQLQMEMPKHNFDTWLRATKLLSYTDGVFTIGVMNAYARDWLDDRLTSTLQRKLTGLVNRRVQVQFVVHDGRGDLLEEDDEEEEEEDWEDSTAAAQQPRQIAVGVDELSLREVFFQGHREIVAPGYFRRWVPLLGATKAWIVVGFRQEMYLQSGGRQWNASGKNQAVMLDTEHVARWAGVGRATVWRHLDSAIMGYFIRGKFTRRTASGKQQSNQYTLTGGMPLTPPDAERLKLVWAQTGFENDPLASLQAMLDMPLETLLPSLEQLSVDLEELRQSEARPQSVQSLVLESLPEGTPQEQVSACLKLADRLAEKLMPRNDRIHISWYFVEHHLPRLGSAQGWLVVLLADRAFAGRNGEQERDTVVIPDGAKTIAAWLGIKRVPTVRGWFPRLTSHGRQSEPGDTPQQKTLRAFVQRTEISDGVWKMKIEQVLPLSQEDEQSYQTLLDLLGWVHEYQDATPLKVLLDAMMGNTVLRRGNGERYTVLRRGNEGRYTVLRRGERQRYTFLRRGDIRFRDAVTGVDIRFRDAVIYVFETPLNRLIKPPLNKPLIKLLNHHPLIVNTTMDPGEQAAQAPPVGVVWNLEKLLANSRVDRQKARKLVQRGVTPQAWVSWLLYWASPAGENLREPVGLSTKRLLQSPQEGAGSGYDRLAQDAERLRYLLKWALRYSPSRDTDWQEVMRNADITRLRHINHLLFGEE